MRTDRQRGFTIVELIVVMVLVGVLGAVAASRFFDRASFDASAYAEQTKSMMRYAQKIAIAQQRPVFVVFGAGSIGLCYAATCAGSEQLQAPAGSNSGSARTVASCGSSSWYCEGMPSGLALSLAPAVTSFYFDALGRPYNAADSGTSTFASTVVSITGDGSSHVINVVAETGYVY